MMNTIKIVALNYDIKWNDKWGNFLNIEAQLRSVPADLFVLPEMFSTGFSMNCEEIADRDGESLRWMKNFAAETDTAVCGSVAVFENNAFYNRFYFVEPSGQNYRYDKRHLFSFAGEDKVYTPGHERIIVNYKGVRILLQVCYDLRFPVFSRNSGDYDAILYVANWPETRIDAWNTLLKARAIENQAYVFGVNRIGSDGNQLHYPASTYCFFADGTLCSSIESTIVSAELNGEKLEKFRRKFQFLKDGDDFKIL